MSRAASASPVASARGAWSSSASASRAAARARTDVQLLSDLSADIRDGSLCGHGITAPNPLTSGMRYFAAEFEEHITRSTCPAGVCSPLRVAGGIA